MNVEWNILEAEVVFTAQNGQEVLEYMKVNYYGYRNAQHRWNYIES